MGCKDGGCTCGDETPVIETESPCEEAEPEIIYIISTPSLPCDDVLQLASNIPWYSFNLFLNMLQNCLVDHGWPTKRCKEYKEL